MADVTTGREVIDLDDLMPEGWIARIKGTEFPIPGDLPMELWLGIRRDFDRAQRIDEETEDDEAVTILRALYDKVVQALQIETPEAVPEQLRPEDWDDDEDGEWSPEYERGAVVIPDMSPMHLAAFVAGMYKHMENIKEAALAGDPPKARPRKGSTTRSSRSGSGSAKRRSSGGGRSKASGKKR